MSTNSKTEKQALKRRETVARVNAKVKGVGEPTINFMNYKVDLIQALNWYNIYASNADKKNWALDYISDHKQKSHLSKLDDELFRQVGTLVRIVSNDQYLDTKELDFISRRFDELLESGKVSKPKVAKVETTKVSAKDKYKDELTDFISEIDQEIDIFINSGYPKNYTFKTSAKSIPGQVARLIPNIYKLQIRELEEVLAKTCEQLNESYGHLKTSQVKNFLKLLQDLVSACSQQVVSVKKPASTKPKSPTVLIRLLKYLPKFDELSLVSEKPTKLVDCQEAWLYDTIRRKLQLYKAVKGSKMTVKGTTIIGFDIEQSGSKTIRKPELLKEYSGLSKKDIGKQYTELSSKPQKVNGRTNENTIILKVFV